MDKTDLMKRGTDMREIKFRGKTANGEWVYGSLVHSKNIQPAIYFEVGKGSIKTFDFVYVKPETVGQFTGLHDSTTWKELTEQERKDWVMEGNMPSEWRGRRIFEGDIIKHNNTHFVLEGLINPARRMGGEMSYTIKPLNWGELRTSNGIGAAATNNVFWIQVKPMNQAEPYTWEIQRGKTSIMSGVSQTLEQGKIDCENAWRKFLSDNFLKEETLDYNLEQLGLK